MKEKTHCVEEWRIEAAADVQSLVAGAAVEVLRRLYGGCSDYVCVCMYVCVCVRQWKCFGDCMVSVLIMYVCVCVSVCVCGSGSASAIVWWVF